MKIQKIELEDLLSQEFAVGGDRLFVVFSISELKAKTAQKTCHDLRSAIGKINRIRSLLKTPHVMTIDDAELYAENLKSAVQVWEEHLPLLLQIYSSGRGTFFR